LVAAPVVRLFLSFQPGLGLGLGLVAFLCTAAGAAVAVRMDTTAKAVGLVFVSNVVPPTLVCAPTIVGVLFSFPSGLAAFAVTLPLVLLARRSARSPTPGHVERERLLGAAFLLAGALLLAAFELRHGHARDGWWEPSPIPMAALGALALALAAALPDLYRVWLRRTVRRGGLAHLALREDGVLERAHRAGDGPLRQATAREALGRLHASPRRAAAGVALSLFAAASVTAGVGLLLA
jgi:hypothetical protein